MAVVLALLRPLNANLKFIRATNASGTAYGNEVTVTTAKGTPAVTTTVVTDIQPLTAKSGGNVVNDGGATVSERGVVFSIAPNPTIANNKITSGTGTGTFTATLTPLASQQTYYARAYATNSYGTGYGKQVQFNAASANTVTDIDGNVYPYVTRCGKTWMASNLKTTKYKNGDAITDGTDVNFNWSTNTNGAYTYPNGQSTNNTQYGKLYNLAAIRDNRGVCPTGWHAATDQDWQDLEICYGMDAGDASSPQTRICPNGAQLFVGGSSGLEISKGGWGFIDGTTGKVIWGGSGFTEVGIYWSSTQGPLPGNWYRILNRDDDPTHIYRHITNQGIPSVRCVKD
jgi:uncharacterized protein (TIGR02145 family)